MNQKRPCVSRYRYRVNNCSSNVTCIPYCLGIWWDCSDAKWQGLCGGTVPAQEWPNEPRDIGFIALLVFVYLWLWWSVAPVVACTVLTYRQSLCNSDFCNICNISEMRLSHNLSSADGRLIANPAGPDRTLWEPKCNDALALHGPRCLSRSEREACSVRWFWKVLPRPRPFVLLRATCRWR